MRGSFPPLVPAAQRRIRALVHLIRTPSTATRLRLRLTAHHQPQAVGLADLEAALAWFDTAVERLLPLAAGVPPNLERLPSNLVSVVAAAARAAGAGARLHTPATLSGHWDGFAVACIVRNLLSLAMDRPTRAAALTLARAPGGATLALLGTAPAPPPDDARRWLIQHLARAHGGRVSFSFEPGRCSAQLFLAGDEDREG
jgi:hypothetical protein